MTSGDGGADSLRGSATPGRPRRQRTTRRMVLWVDFLARQCITFGGIGTILAVSTVCLFLVWVVVPLFRSADVTPRPPVALESSPDEVGRRIVAQGVDEFVNLVWSLSADGVLEVVHTATGQQVARTRLDGDAEIVAASFEQRDGNLVLAYADATIRLGTVEVPVEFLSQEDLPPDLHDLPPGHSATHDGGLIEKTSEGLFRRQTVQVEMGAPIAIDLQSPVALIDASISSRGKVIALLTEAGELRVAQVTERKNLLTGKVTARLREGRTQVEIPAGRQPARLILAGLGDNVLLACKDGTAQRFDTRTVTSPVLAETLDLTAGDAQLTAAMPLIGKTSVITGDSAGRVGVWFRIKPKDAETVDGAVMVQARTLLESSSPVRSIAPSASARLAAILFEDGRLQVVHTTSEKRLVDIDLGGDSSRAGTEPAGEQQILLAPRNDALILQDGDRLRIWDMNPRHPEITWSAIFRPVWYEGYERPEHVWQSSSGTDDFEEKYGLMPLVFGTCKATLYSMLFAIPLALLAAIYTSEFLDPRWRSKVKPTIEIMASLPSVVLGFLAALFFAPIVQGVVPQCLAALATIPFALLLGAQIWQLLPTGAAMRLERYRIWVIAGWLPVGLWLAALCGPLAERWLFSGDMMAWLDGQIGTGEGGWMLLTLPASALLVAWCLVVYVTPVMRRWGRSWSRTQFALLDLVKFAVAAGTTVALAYGIGYLLARWGWDPRGIYLGTYVQRNSLIVGAIMGFAVIPIIYTISDDALNAVPDSLRAASLGAGATRWQTAVRVVIPTAMSGLFSAMMVGLGRAVGETMIVLMAAGNTPIMDWNIFNGFRTLSANIAVELPEAVIDSTHYRMLFFAALVLFLLTFLVNTVAEVVRLRFRKRAFQL